MKANINKVIEEVEALQRLATCGDFWNDCADQLICLHLLKKLGFKAVSLEEEQDVSEFRRFE